MAGSDFTTLHLRKGSKWNRGNVQMKRKLLAENLGPIFTHFESTFLVETKTIEIGPVLSSRLLQGGAVSNVYKRRSNQLQALEGVLRSSQDKKSIITVLYSPHFYYLKCHILAQRVMLTVYETTIVVQLNQWQALLFVIDAKGLQID